MSQVWWKQALTCVASKMCEMHHWPADPALHLPSEKATEIFYGPYLQIACSHASSSKGFLSYLVITELMHKCLGAF